MKEAQRDWEKFHFSWATLEQYKQKIQRNGKLFIDVEFPPLD